MKWNNGFNMNGMYKPLWPIHSLHFLCNIRALVGVLQIGCFCTGHYVRFWVLATFATCVGHLEFNIRNMASKVLGINLDDQWVVE